MAHITGSAEPELRRLLAHCSSAECRAAVEEWIRNAEAPKLVEIFPFFNEERIKVAQHTMTGERDLPAKLPQFPAGTAFRIAQTRSEEETEQGRVEAAIRAAGHSIVQ